MKFVVVALLLLFSPLAQAERLKELVEIEGVRPNMLIGLGLVVGLNGTGDDATSPATRRALLGLMKKLGFTIDQNASQLKAKNVAIVTLTAQLPPFARAGASIDVLVSSAGTAKSLSGGTLLLVPLKGPDFVTYALAQGPLSLGGFAIEGKTGSNVVKNHPTVARIPGGARVERDAPGSLGTQGQIVLLLRSPDFTTATRIAEAATKALGSPAEVRDPAAVIVKVPKDKQGQEVGMISTLEALEVTPDTVARIVIDERTGTIVVGGNVTLQTATIAHGSITVRVREQPFPLQPGPFSQGKTVVVPQTDVDVDEKDGRLVHVPATPTAADVAKALNSLGVKPRDLVSIFQALQQAGALRAEILML